MDAENRIVPSHSTTILVYEHVHWENKKQTTRKQIYLRSKPQANHTACGLLLIFPPSTKGPAFPTLAKGSSFAPPIRCRSGICCIKGDRGIVAITAWKLADAILSRIAKELLVSMPL